MEMLSTIAFTAIILVSTCCAYTTTTSWASPAVNITNDNVTSMMTPADQDPLIEAYLRLRNHILVHLTESQTLPPIYNSFFQQILISFEPLQIISLDEILQSISISSAVTLIWFTFDVGWDPRQYDGIEWIHMPSKYFWTPKVTIPKTAIDEWQLPIPEYVNVSCQGIIAAFIPIITHTLCNLDLTLFPFDEQNCTIVFVEANKYDMNPHPGFFGGHLAEYLGTNAEWTLVNDECFTHESIATGTVFQYVICHVHIRRRSIFYVVNLIGPMTVTSFMTAMVFWIPAEGGEKISFIVSMFMSTSVFYDYISKMTPRSMEHLPRVNILLLAIAVQIILATAATAYTLIRQKKMDGQQKQQIGGGKQNQEMTRHEGNPNDQRQISQSRKKSGEYRSQRSEREMFDKNSPMRRNQRQIPSDGNEDGDANTDNNSIMKSDEDNAARMEAMDSSQKNKKANDYKRSPSFSVGIVGNGSSDGNNRARLLTPVELDKRFFIFMFVSTVLLYLGVFLISTVIVF